jgi:hypothetical protein
MLELRPSCECCDKDLPPSATDAMICTFECTFCRECVESRLKGVCPNCGGNFALRPIRPVSKLVKIRRRRAVYSILRVVDKLRVPKGPAFDFFLVC